MENQAPRPKSNAYSLVCNALLDACRTGDAETFNLLLGHLIKTPGQAADASKATTAEATLAASALPAEVLEALTRVPTYATRQSICSALPAHRPNPEMLHILYRHDPGFVNCEFDNYTSFLSRACATQPATDVERGRKETMVLFLVSHGVERFERITRRLVELSRGRS